MCFIVQNFEGVTEKILMMLKKVDKSCNGYIFKAIANNWSLLDLEASQKH